MALWKPFRGNRASLDIIEKHDGYVYFCVDDGSLFFDYTDADGILQRKQINAKDAETLCGMSLEEIKTFVATQADWNQNDETAVNYVKNRTHYIDETIIWSSDSIISSSAETFASSSDNDIGFKVEGDSRNIYVAENTFLVIQMNSVNITLSYNDLADENGIIIRTTRVIGQYDGIDVTLVYQLNRKTALLIPIIQLASAPTEDVDVHWAYKRLSIVQLDEKYIPDTIARTTVVDDIATRVGVLEEIDHDAYITAIEAVKTDVANQNIVVLGESQAYTDAAIAAIDLPIEATDDEVMALLSRQNVVTACSDATGYTYTDIDEKILTL